ncbi:hypothetical protein SZ52_08080 [Brachyspira hyodysenteriae]|nr:hypothetical protein SZ52_08080 [Brachyspira hyodysenteriae]
MNFIDFLEEYKNIEIPMIQRDYAQGRKSQTTVANNFLNSIFETLDDNQKPLHIDFIYGYEENDNFILIDGQQRITTLWLLYLIVYNMNDALSDKIKNLLKKFSYTIRYSSQDFCEKLIDNDLLLDNEPPKQFILNSGGYFGEKEDFDNDPTIKAMLNMLDLIYNRVKDKDNETLQKYKNNLNNITFSIFNMGKYNLGEELYIKMNARGRQLSKYENLKAYIESNLNLKDHYDLLASIDNLWSDYFFDIKDKDKFDNRGLSFLYYSALFFYIDSNISNKDLTKYLSSNIEIIDHIFFSILKSYKNIKFLNNAIEVLCKYKDILNVKIFDNIKLSIKDICYFYAFLFFMKKLNIQDFSINDFNENIFNDYYRVCRHFIENHRLDKPELIKSFYDLFADLSNGYDDIYKYLDSKSKSSSFHTEIYELERRKSKLILESRDGGNNWEDILNKTSDNNFLVGWIGFLLDFSKNGDKEDFNKFIKYTNLTIEIIDKIIKENGFLNLFQRALLIFEDYGFYYTNYYYGNIPQTNIYRDREAWNWLFSGRKNNNNKYFQNLLDRLLILDENMPLKEKLENIILNTDFNKKTWYEYLLIKEPRLFQFITEKKTTAWLSGRIKKYNSCIFLLRSVKPNKNYIDILTYSFYLYCSNHNIKVSNIHYETNKDMRSPYFFIIHKNENLGVICDSVNSNIKIGTKKYEINLQIGSDIFKEYDKVLKEAKLIK